MLPQPAFRPLLSALLTGLILLAATTASCSADLGKAGRILVVEAQREIRLIRGDVTLKAHPIALGPHPKGPERSIAQAA